MNRGTTKLKPIVPRPSDGGLVMAPLDPNNLPANANNKNAFAGLKLGVPASPLEAMVSMNPSDYTYGSMPAYPPGTFMPAGYYAGYPVGYSADGGEGAATQPPKEEDQMMELLDGVIELDDDSLRSLLGDDSGTRADAAVEQDKAGESPPQPVVCVATGSPCSEKTSQAVAGGSPQQPEPMDTTTKEEVEEEEPPEQPFKRVKSEAALGRHARVGLSELPFDEAVDTVLLFLRSDRRVPEVQRQAAIDAVGALKVPLLAAVEVAKSKEPSVGKSEVGAEVSKQRNSPSELSDTSTRSSGQRTTRSKAKKSGSPAKNKRK